MKILTVFYENRKAWLMRCAVGLAVAFVGLICLLRMASPKREWNFTAKDLILDGDEIYFESDMIDGNAPGWYVDNGMEYGETFALTPKVDLRVGSYDVVLKYQTNEGSSNYSFQSANTTYRVLLGRDKVSLDTGKREMILENFYMMPEEGFQVSIAYGGDGYLIVNGVSIRQTRALERVTLFGDMIVAVCFVLWLRFREKIDIRRLCRYLGVAFAAQLPFLCMYLYKGDDLSFHLLRIEGIAKGLACGQLPVRIQPEWMNGYGYPVSVFYSDGILAVAGFLRFIGLPLQSAYKLYVFIINVLTYAVAEYSIKRILRDERIAFVGGILYTLCPYRLLNIYDRSAVGEYTAMVFLPLIFVGVYEILMAERMEGQNSWLILTAGITGIIQSHVLTCEMVTIVLGFTCLFFWRRFFNKEKLLACGKAIIMTCLVNLWFLIPFLDYYLNESFHVNSASYGGYIQTMGISLSQLLDLFPRYLGPIVSISEGVYTSESSPAIGIAFILGAAAFIYEYYFRGKRSYGGDLEKGVGRYCLWAGGMLLLASTVWFPWDFLFDHVGKLKTLISMLQFPWRLLSIASLMFTILACVAIKSWKKFGTEGQPILIGGGILIGVTVLTAGSYFSSILCRNSYYVSDVETFGTFQTISDEYLPNGVDGAPQYMPEDTLWYSDGIMVSAHEKNGTNYRLELTNSSAETQYVELPMLYYRGYRAKDLGTGNLIGLEAGENGRIRLYVDGGYQGTVRVYFQEPISWRISEMISLAALFAVGVYLFVQYRRKCQKSGESR